MSLSASERHAKWRSTLVPDHVVGEILANPWVDNAIPVLILLLAGPMFTAIIPNFLASSSLVELVRHLLITDDRRIWELSPDTYACREALAFDADVTAIAPNGKGDRATALDYGRIIVWRDGQVKTLSIDVGCVTAMAFTGPGVLLVCVGSQKHKLSHWKHDLMERGESGSVWRLDIDSARREKLADRLAFPYGVAATGDGQFIVSEARRHRLIAIEQGRARIVLDHLPCYPARLNANEVGRFWLSLFAPRSQMVEFVLRERAYCERMIKEIDPQFWMAPTLSTGLAFEEPLQGGAVKHLDVHKRRRDHCLSTSMELRGRMASTNFP